MKLNFKLIISVVLIVAALSLAAGGYYFYLHPTKTVVEEVGKLIDLPMGEVPTIATVTDRTKLKDQPFFANAKNGDKVLIYANAKKAILYDPSAKKVIDIERISLGSRSAQPSFSPKIILRNGTQAVGLATKTEIQLKKTVANLNFFTKENADNNYDRTIVVVLNDNAKDAALNLAKVLNASISALPAGESKPKEGDVLILLGKDQI